MKNKGFTLIEMIIVVVIICILLAVALPALNKAKIRSARTVVQVESVPVNTTPPLTEECVNGFAFIRGDSTLIQKLGADGLPASC